MQMFIALLFKSSKEFLGYDLCNAKSNVIQMYYKYLNRKTFA